MFVMCLAMGSAAAASGQHVSDEALARVREKLQKPPSIVLLDLPKSDYSVYIEGRRPLAHVFEQPPWVSVPPEIVAPVGGRVAGSSIDPGLVGHAISRAVRTRAARAEVKRSIAEYCDAHRDEPGADQICGRP